MQQHTWGLGQPHRERRKLALQVAQLARTVTVCLILYAGSSRPHFTCLLSELGLLSISSLRTYMMWPGDFYSQACGSFPFFFSLSSHNINFDWGGGFGCN